MTVQKSKYDSILNLLCILLLVGNSVYLILSWKHIPESVPGHYNAAGAIDRWAKKTELLMMPIVAWVMYIGITFLERFPQLWNTGVKVTPENSHRIYRILKSMIGTTKLIMVAVFTFLSFHQATARALPVWFLPVFLGLTFGTIAFSIVRLVRAK